jgi:hypothetical protein
MAYTVKDRRHRVEWSDFTKKVKKTGAGCNEGLCQQQEREDALTKRFD